MNEEKSANLHDMVANYASLARRAGRYWKRGALLFVLVLAAGMAWVVKKPRVFKSEASAAIHDVNIQGGEPANPEEATAELHARLDQVYGSRANLGRVVDELNLYPWLRGKTSRLKVTEAFQDAVTYAGSGRDAFHLEFIYQDPVVAQRTVDRLLRLYTDERRAAAQMQSRNDLSSVDTAINGLEIALGEQETRLERFERANHDMVEQVRLRRLGQAQARIGLTGSLNAASTLTAQVPISGDPDDSSRTRRLRIRLGALQSRYAALQRALDAPSAPVAAPTPATPAEESERIQTMRHNVADLRDRLARLRTTYTDEYPDVQVTIRRLADAEHELTAALAAEHVGHSRGSVAAVPTNSAQTQAEIVSIQREIEATRGALSAAIRDDRARPSVAPPAPRAVAVAPSVAPAAPSPEDNADPTGVRGAERPLGSLVEVEAMWDRLNADLGTTRTRYQALLTRKFELQAVLDTVNSTGADVLRVIDPPSLPAEPEPPGRTKLAMMVFAAALVLGLGVAGVSGFLDSKLYEPADLRRWGELPELPVIPDLREARTSEVIPRAATVTAHGAASPPT